MKKKVPIITVIVAAVIGVSIFFNTTKEKAQTVPQKQEHVKKDNVKPGATIYDSHGKKIKVISSEKAPDPK